MYGAIIGDMAGSIYEYEQFKKTCKVNVNDSLITAKSFYSDDTILTIAILDAILNDKNYEYYIRKYGMDFLNYKPNFKPYFKNSFSPNFIKWLKSETKGISNGNGCLMRVSSVGYMFDNEEDVIKNAISSVIPSHNNSESIECTILVALIIYYARKGLKKNQILDKLNITLKYKDFESFNTTCYNTIDNCIYAVFTSNSFEESIKKVISFGGDTDTNACIVGSMAEAMYEIDNNLIEQVNEKIPESFVNILQKAYKINKKQQK